MPNCPFSGIAPADVPMFIVAQLTGALTGLGLMHWFLSPAPVLAPDLAMKQA